MPYNNSIHIQRTHAEIHRISSEAENQDQVFTAMKHEIKENEKKMKCQSKCYLLRQLKSIKIGTNDVEHAIRRLQHKCSDSLRMKIKMNMMRQKVSQAYEELRNIQNECNIIWR